MLARMQYIAEKRAADFNFYESIKCKECESTEDLCRNRYQEEETYLCVNCVNSKLDEIAEAQRKEEELEELSREDIEEVIGDQRRQIEKDSKYE